MNRNRIISIAALLALSGAASAQSVTCQHIGDFTYCSDGSSSQRIGNMEYYTYPGARQPRGAPSSSQDIGNFRYYDNGSTRQRIGSFDYYTAPNGRQTTCQRIGTFTYCN